MNQFYSSAQASRIHIEVDDKKAPPPRRRISQERASIPKDNGCIDINVRDHTTADQLQFALAVAMQRPGESAQGHCHEAWVGEQAIEGRKAKGDVETSPQQAPRTGDMAAATAEVTTSQCSAPASGGERMRYCVCLVGLGLLDRIAHQTETIGGPKHRTSRHAGDSGRSRMCRGVNSNTALATRRACEPRARAEIVGGGDRGPIPIPADLA